MVALEHQGHSDDVVSHHLPMILPLGLSIEDEDSVKIESRLVQIIELDGCSEGEMGVTREGGLWVK